MKQNSIRNFIWLFISEEFFLKNVYSGQRHSRKKTKQKKNITPRREQILRFHLQFRVCSYFVFKDVKEALEK